MANRKIALYVDSLYQKDLIFDKKCHLNRDDCLSPFRLLKERFNYINCELHTQDFYVNSGVEPEAVIFNDFNLNYLKFVIKKWPKARRFLIIWESEVIKPDNWKLENHRYFSGIFTWNDKLIDNKKYFKLNFSQDFPSSIPDDWNLKTNFCAIIAGNKKRRHPLELYSKRVEIIRWFEENHPKDLDLYGVGWDRYVFNSDSFFKFFNRINVFSIIKPFVKKSIFPSYKGKIQSKFEVLKNYKFSICYENAYGISGYITEKIFDSFFAGAVPVYLGAPNIDKHIPKDCYIDRRIFKSHEDLYGYLKNMKKNEWENYLSAIKKFIKSEKSYPFSGNFFAEAVSSHVIDEN